MTRIMEKIDAYNKNPKRSKLDALFAFHPSTEKRIAAIKEHP